MTEVLDVSDEEGMIQNQKTHFAIIMFHLIYNLQVCAPEQILLIITDMTCRVALKQAADGAISDDSFDEGTRHCCTSAWLLCRIGRCLKMCAVIN